MPVRVSATACSSEITEDVPYIFFSVFLLPPKTKFLHSTYKQRVFSFLNIWLENWPPQSAAAVPEAGWRVFTILPLTGGRVGLEAISDLRPQAVIKAFYQPLPAPLHLAPAIFHSYSMLEVCSCHSWKVSSQLSATPRPTLPYPSTRCCSSASWDSFSLYEVTSSFSKWVAYISNWWRSGNLTQLTQKSQL